MRPSILISLIVSAAAFGQDRLANHPQYGAVLEARIANQAMQRATERIGAKGWSEDSRYAVLLDGTAYDMQTKTVVPYSAQPSRASDQPNYGRWDGNGQLASPDGKWQLKVENCNIWLAGNVGQPNWNSITRGGDSAKRIKFGSLSWIYEYLNMQRGMWWSPDSQKVAFYRFDESEVKDHYVLQGESDIQNRVDEQAYAKVGQPNPHVQLFVYDLKSRNTTKIDTGSSSDLPGISEYLFNIAFSPKGDALTFCRSNRRQNAMELVAADPVSGRCHILLRESNPVGWISTYSRIYWLSDGKRFLWLSEKTGFWNIYLVSLQGGVRQITHNNFEVSSIKRVDEKREEIWYGARGATNPRLIQLHRIKFDGSHETRLTDASLSHMVWISPDGSSFVDRAEAIGGVPSAEIRDSNGKSIYKFEIPDIGAQLRAGYHLPERFTCLAADGKTTLCGTIYKPSKFDPKKKYPIILNVYAGPESGGFPEHFSANRSNCDYGFIFAEVDGRGSGGRGRAFRQCVYRNLGVIEVDDQAAAMRQIAKLPYIDAKHIGVVGTSYGGYAALMCLARHPEVFAAAICNSPVTDWMNYCSVYTERYMDLPANNPKGYEASSAIQFARTIKGSVCFFIGTNDDDVHPSNTFQMINALDKAGKPYRLYIGADQGHAELDTTRQMEYFIDTLQPGGWDK